MRDEIACQKQCSVDLEPKDISNFKWMIERDYRVNFMIDNLPAITKEQLENDPGKDKIQIGFPVGFKDVREGENSRS